MKFEERKLISIPRAIGLFMIFEGLFRRSSLEGVAFNDTSYHLFLEYSASSSIYLLIASGIFLCITRNLLFFYMTYFTCFASLFGVVFEILPGKETNAIWCISLGMAHMVLAVIMVWTHVQIKKTFFTEA